MAAAAVKGREVQGRVKATNLSDGSGVKLRGLLRAALCFVCEKIGGTIGFYSNKRTKIEGKKETVASTNLCCALHGGGGRARIAAAAAGDQGGARAAARAVGGGEGVHATAAAAGDDGGARAAAAVVRDGRRAHGAAAVARGAANGRSGAVVRAVVVCPLAWRAIKVFVKRCPLSFGCLFVMRHQFAPGSDTGGHVA
ncbi:hypothetical protein BWQ96_01276 [Gracilariopsis chorda]|uniref:Uncharacterized protein n=1 Tax=Gracilariopsis chorda TaxID=448386 RepID=A0A2V3J3H9_9FLOR|nr:hypothetical protein BWQ96_01276 [Gracilariopsis chorda]|eukprot:PXF48934.1 hypothetical protein BWQ96_01276 [Gracilariopsis chorda]